MKVTNPAPGRPERIQRGLASTLRATGRGITLRDNGVDVEPVWDIIAGQGLRVTDLDDGLARLDAIGGTGPDGGPTGGGSIVEMLNNSGQDLAVGDVVVVDETADKAVTVTTTEGDERFEGVVQEPIGIGDVGLVLFNGYTPVINAPTAVRGEYAKTSTTATEATSTTDPTGAFAVYLTGNDFSEFASYELTTTAQVPVASLDIDMPPSIPADRVLFLALWLTDDASSVTVPDWTLIGSDADFLYYYKLSEGDDTATASWTGASVAVATVLLFNAAVHPGLPIQDFDYENTAAAAEVTGLSDAPRYAIAGVKGDVASPGDGYVRLGGGTAGFAAGGSTTLVQTRDGTSGSTGVTLTSPVTVGNMLVAIPMSDHAGSGSGVALYDPRDPGTCPPVGSPWATQADFLGATSAEAVGSIITKIADETYAGPFKTTDHCTADKGRDSVTLLEFSGVSEVAAVLGPIDDQQNSVIDLGTFSGYGADDVIIMAVAFKKDGGGDPAVSFAAEGFTQLVDTGSPFSSGFRWIGYKIGGSANAKVTHGGTVVDFNWGAAAIHLTAGSQGVAGTLAGKYIGHDSSATSPFDDLDAIFAVNLQYDAKASALVRTGPYLGDGGGSEPTADAHIADTTDAHDASAVSIADSGGYFTATDVEAAIAELAKKTLGYQAHGAMGSTETFSALTGWHSGTFDDDCTFTFSDATSGIVASMVLELTEDGTGGWDPTWPGSVVWPGGTPPTHDTTAGTTTIYLFQSRDGGTTWFGFQAGAGGSSVGALDDLTDVVITTPAEDEQLQYVSGQWVNNARRWEPVTSNPGTGPEMVFDGDEIVMTWAEY